FKKPSHSAARMGQMQGAIINDQRIQQFHLNARDYDKAASTIEQALEKDEPGWAQKKKKAGKSFADIQPGQRWEDALFFENEFDPEKYRDKVLEFPPTRGRLPWWI